MRKLLVLIALLLIIAGCTTTTQDKTIRIGAKAFTESAIVSEVYALALEDKGFKVDRIFNVAGAIIHDALVNNEMDMYPEYTGTGLLVRLKMPMETNPQKVYDIVKEEYLKKWNIVWLDYTAANDGQGIVINTKVAQQYGIKTISDLQKYATELRFASQGDFDQREDALPALIKAYGPFDWKSSKVYDNSLKYTVLDSDEADLAPAYTTEGMLVSERFTVLVDDKSVWPPYNLTPIIQKSILDKYPEIETIINEISKHFDTETVIQLNAKVDVDKKEIEDVAKEFYNSIKK